jgi:hypothetical protein
MQGQLWPSREEAAATNLRRAIAEARGNVVVRQLVHRLKAVFDGK